MAITVTGQISGGNTISGTDPTITVGSAPAVFWLVFCIASGNSNLTPTASDNNTSGTYTRLFSVPKNGGADTLSCFVRDNMFANSNSTTLTVAIGAHSAAQVTLLGIGGSAVAGIAAIIQSATTASGTAGGIPSTTFAAAPSSSSLIISGVGNSTNPAGVAVSNSPAWTLQSNTGQVGAGLGIESASGVGGSSVIWGSTSTSTYAVGTVEIGVVAPGAGVDVSKLVAYAMEAPATGDNVSKLTGYMLPGAADGVDVSKLVAYMAAASINSNPPVWPNITFPDGIVGVPYSTNWDLTPAAPPTTYTTVVGSIPPGTTLNNPGQDLGSITGTPTLAGTYTFTLRASNLYGTADKQFTIVIHPPSFVPGFGSSTFTYAV